MRDEPARAGSGDAFILLFSSLTHDYLVHSLRNWLTRKQRETRRGRAELRLAERAALWDAKPENRQLPSVLEWASIGLLTRTREWTDSQRRMMTRASRVHGLRALGLATAVIALAVVGLDVRRRVDLAKRETAASALVQQLLKADTVKVPGIVQVIGSYRRWADPELRRAVAVSSDPQAKLHASLALLPVDPGQADYLSNRLLNAGPLELNLIWQILKDHHQAPVDRFRSKLEDPEADPDHRFRAACAIVNSDADLAEKSWDSVSPFLADRFLKAVIKNPADYSPLLETLRPIGHRLTDGSGVDHAEPRAIRERTDLRDYHRRRLRRRRPRAVGRAAHGRRREGVPHPLPGRRAAGGADLARAPGRNRQAGKLFVERPAARSVLDRA